MQPEDPLVKGNWLGGLEVFNELVKFPAIVY